MSLRRAVHLLIVTSLLLSACSFQSQPAPVATTPPSQGGTPVAAGTAEPLASAGPTAEPTSTLPQGGTLNVRIDAPIGQLTPWDVRSRGQEQLLDLLYNGLVRLDDAGQPQPDLAESWEVAPSGTAITFTLRPDLRWHDGRALTNDDVAWTLNTLRTLTVTNALLGDFQRVIGEVRTPITRTVVLALTTPYAPLLADLAVPILPRHALQGRTPEQLAALDFAQAALGSGPFKLVSAVTNTLSLERNAQYFRGAPNLERVRLVVMSDPAAVQAGLADGTVGLAEFPTVTTTLTLTGPLRAGAYAENATYWLAFNVRAGRLFADPQLRKALALAVDVPQLVQQVVGERGQPLGSAVLPQSWADPGLAPPAADLEQAKQRLDAAGWPLRSKHAAPLQRWRRPHARIAVRADDAARVQAATAISRAAAALGMDITVEPLPFEPDLVSKLAPPYDFDLLLGSWASGPNSAGFPSNRFFDPDTSALFSGDQVYGGDNDTRTGLRNIGGYASAEYDAAAQTALSTYDPAARAAAIKDSEAIIARDRPYLFLWAGRIPVVASSGLRREAGEINLNSPRYFQTVEQWYLAQ